MVKNIEKSYIGKNNYDISSADQQDDIEQKKTVRDCFYSRINVSLRTMDRIICGLIVAIIAALICGIIF